MTRWRLGYMILSPLLKIRGLKSAQCNDNLYLYDFSSSGYCGTREHLSDFEKLLAKRRDLICERLNNISLVFDRKVRYFGK